MAQCTAPVYGHRTASGRANCPVCGGSYRNSYRPQWNAGYSSFNSGSSHARSYKSRGTRAPWSSNNSTMIYTQTQIRSLQPIRKQVEKRIAQEKDAFLCHAWDDRKGIANELCETLEAKGVSVWFSEKDLQLGSQLLREIDKGLSKSKIGIVLVTPAFIERIQKESVADKELSALLSRDLLVPICHDTTFEALREVSPLLASRSGLNTAEESLEDIAMKIAELVK